MPKTDPRWSFTTISLGEPTVLATGAVFPERAFLAVASRSDVEQPVISFLLEVEDGRPVLSQLLVARREGGSEITRPTLRALPLEELVEGAITHVVTQVWMDELREKGFVLPPPPEGQVRPLTEDEAARYLFNRRQAVGARKRRVVTDVLLQEVAGVYNADATGAPTVAVAERMSTSRRNATRWVALARQRGFLTPHGSQGKD